MILLSSCATFLSAELDRVWEALPGVLLTTSLLTVCPALPEVWHHGLPGTFSLRTFRNLLRQNGALPGFSNPVSATERPLQERGRRLQPAVRALPRGPSLCPCQKRMQSEKPSAAEADGPVQLPAPRTAQTPPLPAALPSSRPVLGRLLPLPVWALPTRGSSTGPGADRGRRPGQELPPHLPSARRRPLCPSDRRHPRRSAMRRRQLL